MSTWIAYLVLINGMFVQINNIPTEQDCENQIEVFKNQGTFLRGVCVEHHTKYKIRGELLDETNVW